MKRTTFSSAMVSAIEPIAVVMNPEARNGLSTSSSVASPISPATRNANASEGMTEKPKVTLATRPAKAPIVACEASAKLANRSTAKMAVRPIAGTASMVPAMRPLTISWSISLAIWRDGSDDLQKLELGARDLLVTELAVDDVADVGEIARAAGAFVVDLLAFG